ncbi:MAG TPA: GNAT family N-acetyltransferase [Acidimicrobiales bacterium]|nr:GNAT family N-acetyltransferase [Acidimicrobiales bacterium]
MSEQLRAARREDLPALREIERESGQRYREFGLDQVADDEPASIEVLATYAEGSRAWVAVDPDGVPVGYILVDEVDGAAHIEQVSVVPAHQGRGLGRALIDRVAGWAVEHQMEALTLTTFGHIPWNRPLYEHLGFRVLAAAELGPGLRAVREAEAVHGLDPALRVVMRRELDPPSSPTARMRIGTARRRDVLAAAELYLRSRHAAVPAIPRLVHEDDDVREWFAETVFPHQELWIAEDASGLMTALMVLDGEFVSQLYVDPDHVGVGIGTALLAVAKSLRPEGLQLWTFQSNRGARRFYERHGFVAVEWTDGARNEEGAPDVRYSWKPTDLRAAPSPDPVQRQTVACHQPPDGETSDPDRLPPGSDRARKHRQ